MAHFHHILIRDEFLTGRNFSAWVCAMGTKPKNGRGALYIVWGDKVWDVLARSITSLKNVHPEISIHVERIDPSNAGFLSKCAMFDFSPFAETLFLDADTVVLGDLSFAFEKAARFGLACCIAPSVWARQHYGIEGETIEYSTGVLFFTEVAKPVFDMYLQLSAEHAKHERSQYMGPGTRTIGEDQGPFAAAIEATGWNPFVLPPNWNFHAGTGHRDIIGPIKIWHHYPEPPSVLFDRDFGNDLSHVRVEDLFPWQRGEELRFGWRLLRHGLGLRKRPLFPDVHLGLRPGIGHIALELESLRNSRSQLLQQLCKQIVRKSLGRKPLVTCRPGERPDTIAEFDALKNSPSRLFRQLCAKVLSKASSEARRA
jgi:hypothetical protein